MPRSSPSIAALAGALAKAQAELVNPEKSLIGTIESGAGEGGECSFRYAPLSSGLDIVRKTLGQHEIATVQTTAIDQSAGIVSLTTVSRTPLENGSLQTGRFAPSGISRPHIAWERHLRMRVAMRCSRWWELPERTISMRPI
jgi:hypothetical protein